MIPDGKRIVLDYLRSHPAVSAITTSVRSTMPRSTDSPWVRATMIDAQNERDSRPEHLIDFLLQLDCYAGKDDRDETNWPEANTLAFTVRDALSQLSSIHGGGVVTCVRFTGHREAIDADFEPARARVILDAVVYMHP